MDVIRGMAHVLLSQLGMLLELPISYDKILSD